MKCELCGEPAENEVCSGCLKDWFILEDIRLLAENPSLTNDERLQKLDEMYPYK